jgi:predicted Zn-dependent protease
VAQTLLNPQAAAAAQRTTELYRQIVEREPDNVRALDGLAIALVTEVSIALEVEDEPDRDVLARKIDEAEALALKAKGIGGDSAYDLQFILANTAQFRGDHAGMQAAYAASLEQSPQFDAAYVNLAQAHLLGGDPSRAIALLEKALAIEGREPSDIPLTAMGFAHLMQGDATRAVAVLQRSRIVNPADPTIYALLALANAELNHGAAVQAAKDELRRVAPSYSFRRFERTYKPMITAPEPYRNWWTTRLMPLWSRAGLPGLVQ